MAQDRIEVHEEAGLAVITLNRPELMNALDRDMRAALTQALTAAAQTARAIVLTGRGAAFCSGQDLSEGADPDRLDLAEILREEYEPLLQAITDAPVPVLAAVNGVAAGAGANLALACDVVIAAESAVFLQAFSRIGLIPDAGGTYWLPRQVGLARAMGAAFFAEPVTARQAADWGMIWEAAPDHEFEATWQARARHLAAGPTAALRATKQALRAAGDSDFATQLELEAKLQGEVGRTADFREGVTAFLEKRAPRFSGR
ncbi:2-(1,2-epoxy-1,2-dihydrophenyl)acetyl-CoA isomerase [Mesobaculum littorinae]|uniref:2-(1,2-epoxy-1,2-dihydrophenyl)acetyl-CoA isomerase n=1 Tax=Mesobaculum littorinae TaxID=2486419 RepID=A0A438AL65_9RHOB|nr:enoyl-CoA hydratase-related protein [Mesobaculum littorinae]RVV99374.1 2-(1,2-epoxy-1,2-dihydrophenyl)acetyl-CoA isomerase [Mesobaculum littorinae]